MIMFYTLFLFWLPINGRENQNLLAELQKALKKAESLPVDETSLTIEKKARVLGPDIAALYSFVRDEIKLEPYSFHMREPEKVLMGKAGSSLDQALLLWALCEQHGIRCRLVQGKLSDETASNMLETIFTESVPLKISEVLNKEITADTLHDRDLLEEVKNHFWLQYYHQKQRTWIDLDPSTKDADPGKRLCEPVKLIWHPPQNLSPELKITVHLEVKKGDKTVHQIPLTFKDKMSKLIYEPLHLVNVIGREIKNGKFIVTGFQPILVLKEKSIAGKAVGERVGSSGFSPLFEKLKDSLQEAEKVEEQIKSLQLSREWIEFTLSTPDGRSKSWTYDVFNIGDDLSLRSAILVNIFISNVLINENYFNHVTLDFIKEQYNAHRKAASLDLNALHSKTKASDLKPYEEGTDAALRALMGMNQFIGLFHAFESDRILKGLCRRNGVVAYYASPRMIITSTAVGESGVSICIDLAQNRLRVLIPPGAPLELKYLIHQSRGLLESHLENELLEKWTGKRSLGAANLLTMALNQDIPFVRFSPGQEEKLKNYDYSPIAKTNIKKALSRGDFVLMPERMFLVGDRKTIAWWEFDGKTGEPVSVSEQGRHQAMTEHWLVKTAIVWVYGNATVFFLGVLAGLVTGSISVIGNLVGCVADPTCKDKSTACARAWAMAMDVCKKWANVMNALLLDLYSLLGGWQIFSAERGCVLGIVAPLLYAGC